MPVGVCINFYASDFTFNKQKELFVALRGANSQRDIYNFMFLSYSSIRKIYTLFKCGITSI